MASQRCRCQTGRLMTVMITDGAPGTAALTDPAARPAATRVDTVRPQPAAEGGFPANDILTAVAAERARIAREMQDCVSGCLADIAQAAVSLLPPERPADPDTLDRRLRELVELTHHAVAESQRAIGGLGDQTPSGSDGPGPSVSQGLTPREKEIMDLIAEGLSNRQIAERLVISPKTVKNHICNIYQRIGIHERRQAVSLWREL
jgi:DNA-binding CsgD family transcriptional regulator